MSGDPSADQPPAGIVRVRADNPSMLTLDGTNSYIVDRWVVDAGPDDRAHIDAVLAAAPDGIEGIVLTHGHSDHSGGAATLAGLAGGVPVVRPADGERVGPLEALATPGHAPDHVCLLHRPAAQPAGAEGTRSCFTGDTVLGAGSVFIAPGEGSLAAYLDSLRRLRELDLDVLLPGHGPAVTDANAKLDEYLEHRLERERRLLEALAAGARRHDELLDAAWDDVPDQLRSAARVTLAAHLEKLADEGRLPAGVEVTVS